MTPAATDCMIEYVTADGLVALEGPLPIPHTHTIYRAARRRLRITSHEGDTPDLWGFEDNRRSYCYRSREERRVPAGNGFVELLVYRLEEEL
jgi:hypothetical protein